MGELPRDLSAALEHHGQSLADTDADRGQAMTAAAAVQLVGEGARDASPGAAERVIRWRSARISAPSPSETVHSPGMHGFTIRHPRVVECRVSLARGSPVWGLSTTHGDRLIDSTPPAMHSDASPAAIAWLALNTACNPDPQRRLTV